MARMAIKILFAVPFFAIFLHLCTLTMRAGHLNQYFAHTNSMWFRPFLLNYPSFLSNFTAYISYHYQKINRIDSLEGDSYFHFRTEAEKLQVNMPLSYIQVVRASFTNLKRTIVIDSTDNFYSVKMQDNSSRRVEPFVEIKRFYKNTKH